MNRGIDLLRGELERLFTLDELVRMSEQLLGLAPDDVGGASAKGSFALALTERCASGDRIDALVDVMLHLRKDVDPRVRDLAALLASDELAPNTVAAGFLVERRLGRGTADDHGAGVVYRATRGGETYALRILPSQADAARDRRSVQRFLTANRLIARVEHRGLPRGLEAGEVGRDAFYVAHRFVEGESLAARLARTGPTRLSELAAIVRGVLEPLASLHAAELVHGGLRPSRVVLAGNGVAADVQIVLVGLATDRLRITARSPNGAAPELLVGEAATLASDVYAFGALLYELVTGKPPFDPRDPPRARLASEPEAPSRRAPAGFVSAAADALILSCLARDPARRPRDAGAAARVLEAERTSPARHAPARPEAADDAGADPAEVGASLLAAAASAQAPAMKKGLLHDAGRVFDAAGLRERSERVYAAILALDPADRVAQHALEAARKALRKYDELVEMLLARSQSAAPGPERASALAEIGRLYANDLEDPEQAVVAFTQALCEDPANDAYAAEVERLSGADPAAWGEQLEAIEAALAAGGAGALRLRLRLRAARWYDAKLGRVDRALAAYEHVLAADPGNEAAAEGVAALHRRGQQWPELALALLARADRAAAAGRAPRARDLRTEAAEVLETKLGDVARARDLYDAVLAEDPGNEAASEGMARIAERAGDLRGLAAVLEGRAAARRGPAQVEALLKVAQVYEERLDDLPEAARRYEAALAIDPTSADALRGLDRVLNRSARYRELAAVLARQIVLSPTPRQTMNLLERLAALEEEEFLDPAAAAKAYERILAIDPAHAGALEALARLRETAGDSEAALGALETLVQQATTPEATGELWTRAARLLEARGDHDGAVERYRRALDADPRAAAASAALRRAYVERRDWPRVIELTEREAESASSDSARARLLIEVAKIRHRELGDAARAEAAATRALERDPTNAEGLVVLADVAFDAGRTGDAAAIYAGLLDRAAAFAALPEEDSVRVLTRAAAAAFAASTSATSATAAGQARRTYALHRELWARRGGALEGAERADLLYHLGESARRAGEIDAAIDALREAALAPSARVLVALAKAYDAREDWASAVDARRRALEAGAGVAERFDLLLEIGDVLLGKLGDRAGAADAYTAALEARPDDRNLLTKLMQLYSEQEEWEKVCDVVLRLADFVEEPKQRAKYMHTAATIAARSLGDAGRSLGYYRRALEFDPSLDRAAAEAIELHEARAEYDDVERLLKAQLEEAKARADRDKMALVLDRLGDVYREHLAEPDLAVDAYEAAAAFDPTDAAGLPERKEKLADLYTADPAQYLDKALASHAELLRQNPYRVASYQARRLLYAGANRVDAAWCLCQALALLKQADPEEEQFYLEHRARNAAPAKTTLDDEAWAKLTHRDLDPLLTRIFAMLEPVMIRTRTKPIEDHGYDPESTIDCARHPSAIAQTLYYAQGVLAMPPPLVFEDRTDPGLLGMVHARTPAIVLGRAAEDHPISNQAMAFYAGRHLASYRPGFYVRHLVPTGTGLKAWLFAAIKLVVPQFAIAPELAGQVDEALLAMAGDFVGVDKERLASAVSKLLQAGGALDLKKWVAAIDLTGDRVGMLLAHDLQVAAEAIRATEKDGSVAVKDRLKNLVLFSISEEYFTLRSSLGITVAV